MCARPGGYRRGPGLQREGRAINEVTRGLEFPEGPIAMGDGSVLVVEIEGGNLTRVSPDGTRTVVGRCGGGPNGAAIGPDGHAYVCNDGGLGFTTIDGIRQPFELAADNKGGSIQRVDLTTGAVETVYTHCGDAPILSGNDIVFDTHGGFYFNDTVAGVVYYGQPDGSSIHVAATGVQIPNGLGLSPDQDAALRVGDLHRSHRLLGRDRGRHAVGLLCRALLGGGPPRLGRPGDRQRGQRVRGRPAGVGDHRDLARRSRRGKVTVPEHDPFVTNVCFGGADMRTAFITSSGLGRLYSTEWHCPGLRLNYNA